MVSWSVGVDSVDRMVVGLLGLAGRVFLGFVWRGWFELGFGTGGVGCDGWGRLAGGYFSHWCVVISACGVNVWAGVASVRVGLYQCMAGEFGGSLIVFGSVGAGVRGVLGGVSLDE